MKHFFVAIGFLLLFSGSIISGKNPPGYDNNWHQWRGPNATGEALQGNPPIEWNENKNVKWKIEIPGKGHATPIAWGNQLIVQSAIPVENNTTQGGDNYRFIVFSIDRNSGKTSWEKTVKEEVVQERIQETASLSSNSPITDGEYIYAYFGSRGLYCLDFDGNIIWERDFGHLQKRNDFGEGSSPALYDDKLVILWDHEGQSSIFCVDKNTGQDVWKQNRNEPSSWSTPLIIEYNGKVQVITSASNRVRSYHLDDGQVIWECSGLTSNVIPHPVYADGILYVMSGYRGNALMAIQIGGAEGDISSSDAVPWTYNRDTPYVPSPLLANEKLYFLRSNNGSLSCLDAKNGQVHYSGVRLEGTGTVYSSPVGVQDRLYLPSGSGRTYVIKQGPECEILAVNDLTDGFYASPVIIGNDLYLRGFQYLYCVSDE
ncbi:PQQ-binding-like beta-propeller repeat protein [bacterium]|nr:PQQ-binding-like beta-propeller repeat protein [bacterium]